MPVVGLSLDELFGRLGRELPADELEHELHRFGCSVEGWAEVVRWRCPGCGAVLEAAEQEGRPVLCDVCGLDLRALPEEPEIVGRERVLRMELLAVRPDLFDAAGLARALRGFLGWESGPPAYRIGDGPYRIAVDPALAGPDVVRPRIAAATVHGLTFDDRSLRSLMKLQEGIHWALGRDRKLASIGVYDLAHVEGRELAYRATLLDEPRFVPLGFDPGAPDTALTPREILERHPKGRAFARLLAGCRRAPLLVDERGGVLSMPPIINSEATRVTVETRDVLIDVTGLADRHVDKALNIVVSSLLEVCPDAEARRVTVAYADGDRLTPDFSPQRVVLDAPAAARLVGVDWSPDRLAALLGRMRHGAVVRGEQVLVDVPAWRADVLHPRDLVEDAAIAHGYDRIAPAELARATYGQRHPREELLARARRALVGQGLLEVMTLVLSSEAATFGKAGLPDEDVHVRIENPISVDQTIVRVSVLPGLLETLAINLNRPYPQRICEVGLVGRVEPGAETGAVEQARAGLALAGDGLGYADVRAACDAVLRDLGVDPATVEFRPVELPLFLAGRGAEVRHGEQRLGVLGEVSPEVLERYRVIHPVAVAEFDLEAIDRAAAAPDQPSIS
ncbi:MAG: phenylalanine--tRNA ligase subunit beta [Acidobacteria bacterium]|nr:MAG: phenylalanine--tRNA ligase subunit beta [Acidobacteriota bacterium]